MVSFTKKSIFKTVILKPFSTKSSIWTSSDNLLFFPLWMGYTSKFLCMLCNFLLRNKHFGHYNVVTLEIRFSSSIALLLDEVVCCYSCLFSLSTFFFFFADYIPCHACSLKYCFVICVVSQWPDRVLLKCKPFFSSGILLDAVNVQLGSRVPK